MSERYKDEVLMANESFYRAIAAGDSKGMEELWLRDKEVKCVHPGWPMLYGREAVMESWKNIFENGGPLQIELSDVSVEISGDVAFVICIEKISHRLGDEIQAGFAQSTNIFVRSELSWLICVHHASPMPTPAGDAALSENLQ